MAQVGGRIASGSTNGRAVKIAATASAGTVIHTVATTVTTAGLMDEVWLYGYNSDTVSRELTLQMGGTATPDDDIKITLAPKAGLVLLVPGLRFNNGVVIRGYCAAAANAITVFCEVNQVLVA